MKKEIPSNKGVSVFDKEGVIDEGGSKSRTSASRPGPRQPFQRLGLAGARVVKRRTKRRRRRRAVFMKRKIVRTLKVTPDEER